MAQDITGKQSNFVGRYASGVTAFMDAVHAMIVLKIEWDANAFATGSPALEGTNFVIPDAQVQVQRPACTAAMLNQAVAAMATIIATYNSNVGSLTVLRP